MKKIRIKINKVDKKIEKYLDKRLSLIEKIAEFKKINNLEIYQKNREDQILKKYEENNFKKNIFENILINSKQIQRNYINNKAALIGNNISYSKSIIIHNLISKYTNLKYDYELIDIQKEDIEEKINLLKSYKYLFFNITIPYKNKILEYVDYFDNISKELNSSNLILLKNDKIYAYNTDYYGALYLLKSYNFKKEDEIFIFGSGASANLLKYILKKVYNKDAYLVSRTKVDLDNKVISYQDFEKLTFKDYVLINATPLGNLNYIDKIPCSYEKAKNANFLFDLNYNPKESLFLKQNKNHENGLKMLISQALYSQIIFFDLKLTFKEINQIIEKVLKDYD